VMNIVCFPSKTMDISVLREILRGGLEKINESGAILIGGHSVDDPELKYGLSVTGIVHPDKVIRNSTAQPGDQLILTKPLGTGIINTAIKAGMADDQSIEEVTAIMAMLNKQAAELMQETVVHAATDVTGFGFLGHACEMIQNKDIGFEINHAAIPILSHAVEFAQMGLIPAGAYRNRDFRSSMVDFHQDVPVWASDILFDPQTSGGLLIAVPENDAAILVEHLRQAGYSHSVVIGKAANSRPGMIFVV